VRSSRVDAKSGGGTKREQGFKDAGNGLPADGFARRNQPLPMENDND
jgi:hypothetical protein